MFVLEWRCNIIVACSRVTGMASSPNVRCKMFINEAYCRGAARDTELISPPSYRRLTRVMVDKSLLDMMKGCER